MTEAKITLNIKQLHWHRNMGFPSAFITIDDYSLKTTQLNYRRWKFRREDRVVVWTHRQECMYVISAEVLRKRLAEAGFDRAALEVEFAKCVQDIFSSNAPELYFESHRGSWPRLTTEQIEAFRKASLDDWLLALKKHMAIVREGHPYLTRKDPIPRNLPARINALVAIIDSHLSPVQQMFEPEHRIQMFPCRSLDCMAVAMLEVVPSEAECVLDVTLLVDHGLVYCFEDLCPSTSSSADEEDDI